MDYSAEVMRRFRRGARAGTFGVTGGQTGHGTAGSVASGGRARIELRLENGRIADTRFMAFGGPHLIAVCEWMAEWLIGRKLGEVDVLKTDAVVAALDLPIEKTGCVLLAEDALKAALAMLENEE